MFSTSLLQLFTTPGKAIKNVLNTHNKTVIAETDK